MARSPLGGFECRLCSTLHATENAYLIHTQGQKHQTNLKLRQKQFADSGQPATQQVAFHYHDYEAIGKPDYVAAPVMTKEGKCGVLVRVEIPAVTSAEPLFRIVSSYEQLVEDKNKENQYLVVYAEPYEVIGFRIPGGKIAKTMSYTDNGSFYIQVIYD